MIFPTDNRLQFDDVRHTYLLDGKPAPSVTKVISNISEDLMLSTPFIRKTALGSNVHKVCEAINLGEKVNLSALSDEISPYVCGYTEFLAGGKYEIIHAEKKVYNDLYHYAGTVDIIAKGPKGRLAIMDIKTSAMVSPTTALQLAAYEQAVRRMCNTPKKEKIDRICIWLTGDGHHELVHYKEEGDWNVFLCKLVAFNWDRKVGLK